LCTEINNTVDVVVHNCSDLDSDVYYAWQPRLSVKPSACPRCKTRIDIVRTPLR
jgi:DNA replicative helicase MCM subunit Mcm2 (Cdc46/Mcm family)